MEYITRQKDQPLWFFDYAVNEALFISDKEEFTLNQIIGNISQEYHSNMDKFSHDIIITLLESLLTIRSGFISASL